MAQLNRQHQRDDQHVTEQDLVTHSQGAHWLEGTTDNPSHLGLLLNLPMKTVEIVLQMIPADTATDLQRHVHESVHYVTDGVGWSEIRWSSGIQGDVVFTPPWIWHSRRKQQVRSTGSRTCAPCRAGPPVCPRGDRTGGQRLGPGPVSWVTQTTSNLRRDAADIRLGNTAIPPAAVETILVDMLARLVLQSRLFRVVSAF